MDEDIDPIGELAHTLDALDEHLRQSVVTFRRSERNRLNMLHVHALFAIAIGPLFAAVGESGMRAASWAVIRQLPGAPYSLGFLLFVGGVILAVATMRRDIVWEMVGLWVLLVWYATISLSFGAAVFLWLAHGALPGLTKPAPYTPVLYLHFVTIMGVHLNTLRRINQQRRSQR